MDPLASLFDRRARRPALTDGGRRLRVLSESFGVVDLSDEAAARQMIALRAQLSEIHLATRLDTPASADERETMVAMICLYRPATPFLSSGVRLERADAATQDMFDGLSFHYNTLLMGVPEVFLGFEAAGRSAFLAPLIGLDPDEMEAWTAAMKTAHVPRHLLQDRRRTGEWLSYWHPGLGLEDHPLVVPAEQRARVRAFGCALHLVDGVLTNLAPVDRFMNTYEAGGVVGATPSRLIARDPDTWLPRLPALAGAWRAQQGTAANR